MFPEKWYFKNSFGILIHVLSFQDVFHITEEKQQTKNEQLFNRIIAVTLFVGVEGFDSTKSVLNSWPQIPILKCIKYTCMVRISIRLYKSISGHRVGPDRYWGRGSETVATFQIVIFRAWNHVNFALKYVCMACKKTIPANKPWTDFVRVFFWAKL